MKLNLDVANVATWLVLIYAIAGAALVVISALGHVTPELQLSFGAYLEKMSIAVAGLAVGRGLKASSRVASRR